jgi:hypothetical protein
VKKLLLILSFLFPAFIQANYLPYGSSIQVVWNGKNGNGILCLDNSAGDCGNYCPSVTCAEIPVITPISAINGPAIVCAGSQTKYNVPDMTGSVYNWNVTGAGGTIISGQGTHEILVEWGSSGTALIHVDYENRLLDCGGTGDITVEIMEDFTISGPDKSCPNADIVFSAVNPANVSFDWTATDNQNQVHFLGSGSGTPDFTVNSWNLGSGTFIITATDNSGNYCNTTASLTLEIKDAPPPPAMPTGDDWVCAGTPHLYSGTPSNAVYYLQWSVTNGSPASATGNDVSIAWNANLPHNYSISLVQVETVSGCVSDPTLMPIQEKLYTPPLLAGDFAPCMGSVQPYIISNVSTPQPQTGDYIYDQIQWIIIPSTAGSVISGQGTLNANIQWNNGVASASIQIKTTLCGYDNYLASFSVNLRGVPALTITSTGTVCENTPLNFSFSPPITGSGVTYLWSFGDGSNSSLQNPTPHAYDLSPGAPVTTFYVTLVVDNNGCTSYASSNISVNPEPLVEHWLSHDKFCPPLVSTISASLTLQSGSFNYLWSNGSATSATSLFYTDPQPFTVTVTNAVTGCSASESFSIPFCQAPSTCNNDPTVDVAFSYSAGSDCLTKNFLANISGGNPPPASLAWDFGDQTSDFTSSPSHTYSSAGHFKVCLYAFDNLGVPYCDFDCQIIDIPLYPDFTTAFHCSSTPGSYDVEFIDLSTYLYPISNWDWYEGSTLLGSGVNPVFTLSPGVHNITLKLKNANNDVCERTIAIPVPLPPSAAFTVSGAPFCEKQTIVHLTASNTNVHHALWDFGDGSLYMPLDPSAGINTDRVFNGSGYYSINLTVTDKYGCNYSSTQQVTVNENKLGGSVMPLNTHFCPGANETFWLNLLNTYSPPTAWLWTTGATTPTITVTQTGSYNVTVSDNKGCSFSPAVAGMASVFNVPQPVIRGNLELCFGEDISLNGNQGPAVQYLWTVTDPNSTTTTYSQPDIVIANAQTGIYSVTLEITANGCSRSTQVSVTVHPPPALPDIQSNPNPPCEEQAIDLSVTNAGSNWINWSNGASGTPITVYNAGVYRATVTDAYGCTAFNDFQVYENPYSGFFNNGCMDFCDTVPITIPGSTWAGIAINYAKWEWFVDGQSYSAGANSPVADLILGTMNPGVYVITLHLVAHYPDGDCDFWTKPLEITIRRCPCRINPKGSIYCMEYADGDINLPHNYHFEINTNYDCSVSPNLTVTSPDGGVTLLSSSILPQYLSGILATTALYPQTVCFDLNFTDVNSPECNCNYRYCMKLPKCGIPGDCNFEMPITGLDCIGHDAQGHPVYTLTIMANPFNYSALSYSVQGGILAGIPATIGPGISLINATFTDLTPFDGFCIAFQVYDFTTHIVCEHLICINNPPGCGGTPPTRLTMPEKTDSLFGLTQLLMDPNPADNMVYLHYSTMVNELSSPTNKTQTKPVGELEIKDMHGKTLFSQQLTQTNAATAVNTSQWSEGVYVVSLRTSAGSLIVKKLVIIKSFTR